MRASVLLLILMGTLGCQHKVMQSLPPSEHIQLSLAYVSGGPGPTGTILQLYNDHTIYVAYPSGRAAALNLADEEYKAIMGIIQSQVFLASLEKQKASVHRFGCCDAEEIGISSEVPPNPKGILHAISFPISEPMPAPVSALITVINETLQKHSQRPFIGKWSTATANQAFQRTRTASALHVESYRLHLSARVR
jgi:hypothetical protein